MTVQPIDVTAVMGMALGGMLILIPLLFALRFALKPVIEMVSANRESRRDRSEVEKLSLRVTLLEQQVRSLGAGSRMPEALQMSSASLPSHASSANRE